MKNDIRVIRARQRISQEELANKAGISRQALSNIENEKANPNGTTIRNISKALGMAAGDIFFDLGGIN